MHSLARALWIAVALVALGSPVAGLRAQTSTVPCHEFVAVSPAHSGHLQSLENIFRAALERVSPQVPAGASRQRMSAQFRLTAGGCASNSRAAVYRLLDAQVTNGRVIYVGVYELPERNPISLQYDLNERPCPFTRTQLAIAMSVAFHLSRNRNHAASLAIVNFVDAKLRQTPDRCDTLLTVASAWSSLAAKIRMNANRQARVR